MKVIVKKTRIEQEVIEAHDEETTVYACDCCDFENEDEDVVRDHHARTHAVKDRKKVDGIEFLKFDVAEDLDAWAEIEFRARYYRGFRYYKPFEPGWYRCFVNDEPCPKGCCKDHILIFESARSMIWNLRYEIEVKLEKFTALEAMFGDQEDVDCV